MFAVISHTYWEETDAEVHVYHVVSDEVEDLRECETPGRHGVSHYISQPSGLLDSVTNGLGLEDSAKILGASFLQGRANLQIVVEIPVKGLAPPPPPGEILKMGTGVSYKGWSWKESKITKVTGVVVGTATKLHSPALVVFGQGRKQVIPLEKLEVAHRPRDHIISEIRCVEMGIEGEDSEEDLMKALYIECENSGGTPTEEEIWADKR